MNSLRARLFAVWVLSLAASLAVGLLLVQLYRQSSAAQIDRAEAELTQACDRISERYAYYVSGWTAPEPAAGGADLQRDLDTVASLALSQSRGLVGGILRAPADISPPTPQSTIAAAALAGNGSTLDETEHSGVTTIIYACRLPGPLADTAAWVATEVAQAAGTNKLEIGLAVLMGLMLSLSIGLTWLVTAWSRQVSRVEVALARHDSAGLPRIAPTGEAELDRIAQALNTAGERLRAAQAEAQTASTRAALAERMAALGRVAAGVAHEIRNPIAAMRLRAEGALAIDPAVEPDRAATRGRAALGAILGQVERLDRLSAELLTMTQRKAPEPTEVDLPDFLMRCAADWPNADLRLESQPCHARFDADMVRRALDNLVQNALRHTPPGGHVTLRATRDAATLRIEVEDQGPGVPEALRASLFEPFVTGRADGTGLGLAIAREMVQAHGGTLCLSRAEGGAIFTLRLPQEASQESVQAAAS